jgi:hypothetical protein
MKDTFFYRKIKKGLTDLPLIFLKFCRKASVKVFTDYFFFVKLLFRLIKNWLKTYLKVSNIFLPDFMEKKSIYHGTSSQLFNKLLIVLLKQNTEKRDYFKLYIPG